MSRYRLKQCFDNKYFPLDINAGNALVLSESMRAYTTILSASRTIVYSAIHGCV